MDAPLQHPSPRSQLEIGGVVCDPPVVLAPMAAVTNPPFRILCRELGAGLVVTEMISARGLAQGDKRSNAMLDIRAEEKPVCVQIFGADPATMAAAAEVVEESGADMVDINMGCPMKKVVKSGYGAALLRQPAEVEKMVRAMTQAVSIPVTAKIRAGWAEANAIEVARAVEGGGGAAVTVHARTRNEMFEGHPDLDVISALVESVSIPIIGNGDVRDVSSAMSMLDQTGCHGVMVARGCMGYPWIFRELKAAFIGAPAPEAPSLAERHALLNRHIELYLETYGEKLTCLQIRKHLLWYFRATPGEAVLKANLAGLRTAQQVFVVVAQAVEACRRARQPFLFKKGLDRHPNRR